MSSDKFYVLFEFVNENQSDEDTGSTPCEVGWSQWIQFEGERKSIQELIDNKIQVLTKWPSSCNVASKEVVKKRKGDIQFTEAVATVLAQSDDWVEIVEMSRTFRTYGKVVVDKAERKKIVMINAGSNDPAQVPLGKRKSGENAESKKEVMQAKAATEKKMVSTIVKDTGSRLIGKMSYTELQTSDDEGSSALVGPRKKNVPGNLKRKAKEFNFYDSSDSEDEVLSKMTRHDLQMKVRILQSDKKKLEEKLMVAKSPNSSIGDTYILSQEISHFKSLLKEQLTSFIELKDEVKRLGFELKEELREFSHRLRDELKGRLVEDLKRELKAEFNELWQQKEQPAVQVIQSESYQTLSPSLTCDAGRVFGSSSAVLDLTEIDFKNIVVENGTSEVANIPVTPCVPLTSCPRSPKINFENSGIEEGINAVRETPASPSVSSVCSSNSSKPCNGMRMVNYSEPHPKRLKQTPSRKKF